MLLLNWHFSSNWAIWVRSGEGTEYRGNRHHLLKHQTAHISATRLIQLSCLNQPQRKHKHLCTMQGEVGNANAQSTAQPTGAENGAKEHAPQKDIFKE